jgi:hypothetical protein
MQTSRGLPSVKDLDVPRETGSDGGGHRRCIFGPYAVVPLYGEALDAEFPEC